VKLNCQICTQDVICDGIGLGLGLGLAHYVVALPSLP